jgi:hypothetical protein
MQAVVRLQQGVAISLQLPGLVGDTGLEPVTSSV